MTTSVALAPVARQQFLDANGNPLVGAKLFTYQSGTNTKLVTYQDSTGTSMNTNPILLDSSGRPPHGVWLSNTAYRFVFAPSTDTDPPTSPIYTEDGIITKAVVLSDSSENQWQASGLLPTYISATSFSVVGDNTLVLEIGRRVRVALGTGYVYGTVTSSVYATGITTVKVLLDSGVISTAISGVDYSVLTYSNHAVPNVYSPSIVGKNLLINGSFAINQRQVADTVILTIGGYGHDRWKGGTSGCVYQFAGSQGLTTVTILAASLVQIVESINVPSGTNTLTLSWTGTALGRIGTGAYSTSPVSASVTGGANVQVEFTAGTLAEVQLEKGKFPTTYEKRIYSLEYLLCARYFTRLDKQIIAGYNTAGSRIYANIIFPTLVRAGGTPTIVITPTYFNSSGVLISGITNNNSCWVSAAVTGTGDANCSFSMTIDWDI